MVRAAGSFDFQTGTPRPVPRANRQTFCKYPLYFCSIMPDTQYMTANTETRREQLTRKLAGYEQEVARLERNLALNDATTNSYPFDFLSLQQARRIVAKYRSALGHKVA